MIIKINSAERTALLSRLFGNNIQRAREVVATFLIKWHVHPTLLTFMGLLAMLVAALCLLLGAGARPGDPRRLYQFEALAFILLSSAFDILDGAVARNSGKVSKLGAFLDSCLDRIADGAILCGIAGHYLYFSEQPQRHLLVILTFITLMNAEFISYIKARGENFIPSVGVGFWQRGERIAAILIGLTFGHIPTVLLLLATSSSLTVLRRIVFSARQIHRMETGQPLVDTKARPTGIYCLALWRYPRGHLFYDLAVAFNIAIIIFVDWPVKELWPS